MVSIGHFEAQMPQPLQVALGVTHFFLAVQSILMNAYSFTHKSGSSDPHAVALYRSNAVTNRILNIQIKHAWEVIGFSTFLILSLDRAILPLINE
jgi:hypothetical protein